MNNSLALISLLLGVAILIVVVVVRLRFREIVHLRLTKEDVEAESQQHELRDNWLSHWLFLAGYRSQNAAVVFISITAGLVLFGGIIIYQFHANGTVDLFANMFASIPGGVGNVFIPFALASPWIVLFTIAAIPALLVRAVRRKRIQQVEQDLPLILDLLNTLAQAGIGFDSALDRILGAQSESRPLVRELRSFQYDILAGRPRVDSLRRLARRIEVPTFSTFISAIIQAEQTGAGVANTLRVQAQDLRSRRRERATAAAMAVPTKLIVPMVIGFLPGLFVALLGPMLHQALEMMERTMRSATGG